MVKVRVLPALPNIQQRGNPPINRAFDPTSLFLVHFDIVCPGRQFSQASVEREAPVECHRGFGCSHARYSLSGDPSPKTEVPRRPFICVLEGLLTPLARRRRLRYTGGDQRARSNSQRSSQIAVVDWRGPSLPKQEDLPRPGSGNPLPYPVAPSDRESGAFPSQPSCHARARPKRHTASVPRLDAVTASKLSMDEPGFRVRSGACVSDGCSFPF